MLLKFVPPVVHQFLDPALIRSLAQANNRNKLEEARAGFMLIANTTAFVAIVGERFREEDKQ